MPNEDRDSFSRCCVGFVGASQSDKNSADEISMMSSALDFLLFEEEASSALAKHDVEQDFLIVSSFSLPSAPFKTEMIFLMEGEVFTPEVTDFAVFLACVIVLMTAWLIAILSEDVSLKAS